MALEILETNITLDVYDHDGTRPSIKSIALDDNTRYVFANITYQGERYDIGQDAAVKLIIIRPDKVGAEISGQSMGIEIWDESEQVSTVYGAYAELDQPAIAVSGTLLGQFVITQGDQILRTQIFAVNNGQALDADEWAGQYDGYNLDELVAKVDSAVEKVDGMEEEVSALKSDLSEKVDIAQGTAHAGEALIIGADGNITTGEAGISVDATLSIEGKAADAKTVGDYFKKLLVEEKTDTTITTPVFVETEKRLDSSGNVVGYAGYSNIGIWAIPLDGSYDGIVFNVIKGTTNVKYIAFYSADSYAECNADTLVSISEYTNAIDNDFAFPADAKMCLLNYRSFNSGHFYAIKRKPKPDAVADVNSVADMTDHDQIYRYGGMLYFWNGTEFSEIKSGEDEELNNTLALLVEDKQTNEYIATPNVVAEYKNIDDSGNFVDTSYHTYIWAVPVTTPCTGIGFNTVKGNGKYLAFYTAETFEECNSDTLISLVNYTNNTNVEYPIPEGTKMCLINCRGDYYNLYLYTIEKVSKATEEIDNFRTELNTEIGTTMSVADFGATFVRGYLNKTNGAIATSVYQCTNTEDIAIDRDILCNFDSTIYSVTIYYNNGDNTYSSNGASTTEGARTILKGSKVRFTIAKKGSATRLTDGELITLPQVITFNTALQDWKECVDDNCDYKADYAKMFEKGNSEKLFSNAVGILAAGQSNINGRVPRDSLPSDIVPPFANIKNSINSKTGNFNASMTLGSTWGVDFSLYDALNKLGQDFYVVKWSEGGTSISPYGTGTNKWTPFYEELDSISKSLLWSLETQIRMCLGNNPNTFSPRALIWHQGEGDFSGNSKKAALAYYKNFKCLIAYIRGIVRNERLPVIYGTISHNSGQYCPIIEEAQLKFAREDPYAYCIDMSGASLIDSYHFDADACVYFGRMAYDALIDFGVITGTKINPTRPW